MMHLPVLLFLLPFLAALIVPIGGYFVKSLPRRFTILTMIGTTCISVYGLMYVMEAGAVRVFLGGWGYSASGVPLGIEWVLDPLSALIAVVVSVIGLVGVVGSADAVEKELGRRDTFYYSAVLLLITGLMGMVVTGDLFNLFVFIEVGSISAYALVASGGKGAPRAALRYLLLGSLGASFYLLGIGFLYAATGSLNMTDVAARLSSESADPRLPVIAGIFIVVGLGVKIGMFPLHTWMPSAYARCPLGAAVIMAPLVTKVSGLALLRVLYWVLIPGGLQDDTLILSILMWSGAIGMVYGAVMALLENDFRRLLGYSSISQMGLVVLGIGIANQPAMQGAVLHIANDAIMKAAMFLAATVAAIQYDVRLVSQLRTLRYQAPWTAGTIAVAGISLVGLPPLAGFFGKWYVLQGAMQAEQWIMAGAIVIGGLGSAAYVFRIIEQLYFTPVEKEITRREGPWLTVGACVLCSVGIIVLGLGSAYVVMDLINPGLPIMLTPSVAEGADLLVSQSEGGAR